MLSFRKNFLTTMTRFTLLAIFFLALLLDVVHVQAVPLTFLDMNSRRLAGRRNSRGILKKPVARNVRCPIPSTTTRNVMEIRGPFEEKFFEVEKLLSFS
ncbi:hypothetical protein BC936DRAFT_146335 [Jimgerdemannia flammicorona]|uniref:Uncharacterized protein n=1 Tax=Jimgerdemannia flammicorona TaxID=994334 RepID=A0A433D7V6_9FUNG|nr:hypothetical protein BC936DRAFT_146335 [Jimgerdemannia flammicorona]